ncbi:MAG TPA: hypothetical protein VHQ20_00940 [Patescibacteria group bacterium]|jgi:hypothetical protein|nr:hypothetical protein [Patescibacteria group bacterium]
MLLDSIKIPGSYAENPHEESLTDELKEHAAEAGESYVAPQVAPAEAQKIELAPNILEGQNLAVEESITETKEAVRDEVPNEVKQEILQDMITDHAGPEVLTNSDEMMEAILGASQNDALK